MPTWVIKLTSIINFSTFNTVFTITFNKIFYGLEQTRFELQFELNWLFRFFVVKRPLQKSCYNKYSWILHLSYMIKKLSKTVVYMYVTYR